MSLSAAFFTLFVLLLSKSELAEQSAASAAEAAQLQAEVDTLTDDNQRLAEELQRALAATDRNDSGKLTGRSVL